jgi:hypothetical protein
MTDVLVANGVLLILVTVVLFATVYVQGKQG